MTSPLSWREANPDDRDTLKDEFLCTDPPKKVFIQGRKQHPRQWELDAQSIVKDTRFPLPSVERANVNDHARDVNVHAR